MTQRFDYKKNILFQMYLPEPEVDENNTNLDQSMPPLSAYLWHVPSDAHGNCNFLLHRGHPGERRWEKLVLFFPLVCRHSLTQFCVSFFCSTQPCVKECKGELVRINALQSGFPPRGRWAMKQAHETRIKQVIVLSTLLLRCRMVSIHSRGVGHTTIYTATFTCVDTA